MSVQVYFDNKGKGESKFTGIEAFPENRVYKNLDNPKKISFVRKSKTGDDIRLWKCFGKNKRQENCRFVCFSSSHLEGHLQYNHGGDNPLTLPENIEVLKKPYQNAVMS